ncbi:hypothetical protein NXC14_CH03841 [Rhizobium sp. NXC14]|nr:hypothetical protein NXC14_CH03841 [Rhizobium sp. NXC14]
MHLSEPGNSQKSKLETMYEVSKITKDLTALCNVSFDVRSGVARMPLACMTIKKNALETN